MDEATINELYQMGILTPRECRRINIVLGLKAGVRPAVLADKYHISKVAVYAIRKKLNS